MHTRFLTCFMHTYHNNGNKKKVGSEGIFPIRKIFAVRNFAVRYLASCASDHQQYL